jgi:hypothetical protein
MSMNIVNADIRRETRSDKESNCQIERPTGSQSLQHSKDDNESSPAGPEGVKDERRALTLCKKRGSDMNIDTV